jgi:hypothetical protein
MSQENVEIVRRAFEAFDHGGVEEALPRFAPDIVLGVLMLAETVGRIKGSRVPIRQPFGALFGGFRNGQIGEIRNFLTWRDALEAAGLSE